MDYDTLDHLLRCGGTRDAARDSVAGVLEDIASGEEELRAVLHPLGFLCLPLVRDGPRGVCVHLFESGSSAEPAAAPMHAHSWELYSFVLYGRVVNLPVSIRDRVREPTHRVFEVHSEPTGVDELRPTSRLVRSEPGPGHTSSSGDTYSVSAGEFHATVVARGQPTATLVLGRSLPGHTDLFLGPLHDRGRRTMRQLCELGQTAQTARTALRRVHAEQRK